MDEKLFDLIMRIGEIALEESRKGNVYLEDRRSTAYPLSSIHQTKRGLYLQFVNGSPASVWTPLGEIHLWSLKDPDPSADPNTWTEFLRRLGAVEIQWYTKIEPVFVLTNVDKTFLPKPSLRDLDQYLSAEEVLSAWKALPSFCPRTGTMCFLPRCS